MVCMTTSNATTTPTEDELFNLVITAWEAGDKRTSYIAELAWSGIPAVWCPKMHRDDAIAYCAAYLAK